MKNTKFFLILAIMLVFITVGGVSAEAIDDSTVDNSASLSISDVSSDLAVSDNSSMQVYSNDVSSHMGSASTNVAESNVNSDSNAVSSDSVSSYGLDSSADQVSTYADTSAHVLNDSTYSTYFDADGNLDPDTLGETNVFTVNSLNNKTLNIYANVTLDGHNTGTLTNCTINVYEDGSNSIIQNLIINNENMDGINLLPEVSNVTVFNNIITIIEIDSSRSAMGIGGFGNSKNNKILNNKINITGNPRIIYGINVIGLGEDYRTNVGNTNNYTISNNEIFVFNSGNGSQSYEGVAEGIYCDSLLNAVISNNTIVANSTYKATYGIAISDMSGYDSSTFKLMENVTISSNNVAIYGNLQNFGINSFQGLNINIDNNTVYSNCSHGSFGIGIYKTLNSSVNYNNIVSIGGSSENISSGDALGQGNAAIVVEFNATNSSVVGNIIRTNASTPIWEYGVGTDVPVNTTIANNTIRNITVIKLNTTLTADNLSMNYGDNKNFTAVLKDSNDTVIANQIVLITVVSSNGTSTNYNVTTDAKGVANLPFNLVAGNYTVSGVYAGNEDYNPSNFTNASVIVNSSNSTNTTKGTVLTAPNSTFVSKSGENYTVTLKDVNGNAVVGQEIAINLTNALGTSVIYWATTNTAGEAKLPINLAYPGVYNISASFAGRGNFTASSSNGSVTIVYSLNGTVLTADNMNTTVSSGRNFTATLKDNNGTVLVGREVSFTLFNAIGQNKTYWATTNTDGVAKLPINLAYPSTYYMIVNFPGNNSTAVSNTVNATIIITALTA